ncbi:dGTPase [Marinomonas hwangdonensis]|uniref:dGTPase n=1 Tax=Marinomonas hwangdonensis TaxID=1053647 RepID=A0A3M8Q610_9GAMM|nr:dGTPase [Marinomonas hwangdonensis]RNF51539.1 dGTPase [Marinomonas hwangdonensis]
MKHLISTKRLRDSTSPSDRSPKQQFESDRGRVVFAPAFRRMQSKAQVFSLESNAAVRSRLTHSLEVAHIGKYIAQKIVEKAIEKQNQDLIYLSEHIEPIVETACFLHDIGNPPFGHLGEEAIKEWFNKNGPSLYDDSINKDIDPSSKNYLDITNFDGNPQGLRIAMTLQGEAGKKGLNLTYTQIASLIKYPKLSTDNTIDYKKVGVFSSEADDIATIWHELKLEPSQRHPFVYIMEASDDIAYCLSDIEDGIEKNIIKSEEVLEHLASSFKELSDGSIAKCIPTKSGEDRIIGSYISFRINMINLYVDEAAKRFIDSIERGDFTVGFFDRDETDPFSKALKIIKLFCREHLYKSPEAEDIEIAGYNIVYGLLEKFSILLSLKRKDFDLLLSGNAKGLHLHSRMFGKLPSKLVKHYQEQLVNIDNSDITEWYFRLQLIIDYISGMTDEFALQFYRLLNGIEIKTL